ncbi:hypothetical protein, unlikely [Trypanosoma brucei brucei TREU927]|uniref:Uncharacterized protein n=1 Tax=Trypanosoma brucei brucei (strain 927/4 GUTat10.1) TaxID=185431 RepID=Q38CT0_TRYB2|nr:hypothetical protein, unlikely [Trypanosoma brucei brucei TREU927]EAN77390.1 hypothetical protein, unlikely [Trypanosoma brucei brucei TREU927]
MFTCCTNFTPLFSYILFFFAQFHAASVSVQIIIIKIIIITIIIIIIMQKAAVLTHIYIYIYRNILDKRNEMVMKTQKTKKKERLNKMLKVADNVKRKS